MVGKGYIRLALNIYIYIIYIQTHIINERFVKICTNSVLKL